MIKYLIIVLTILIGCFVFIKSKAQYKTQFQAQYKTQFQAQYKSEIAALDDILINREFNGLLLEDEALKKKFIDPSIKRVLLIQLSPSAVEFGYSLKHIIPISGVTRGYIHPESGEVVINKKEYDGGVITLEYYKLITRNNKIIGYKIEVLEELLRAHEH